MEKEVAGQRAWGEAGPRSPTNQSLGSHSAFSLTPPPCSRAWNKKSPSPPGAWRGREVPGPAGRCPGSRPQASGAPWTGLLLYLEYEKSGRLRLRREGPLCQPSSPHKAGQCVEPAGGSLSSPGWVPWGWAGGSKHQPQWGRLFTRKPEANWTLVAAAWIWEGGDTRQVTEPSPP